MIIYEFLCENKYRFEGWFSSAADFEAQLTWALVRCPQCDSQDVRRVRSAVAIGVHAMSAIISQRKHGRFATMARPTDQSMALQPKTI